MKTSYIDVGDNDWGIIVVYDFDTTIDHDDLSAFMQTFGLNIRNVKRSLRILSTYNSGMAISRDDLRMSIIFIGTATSCGQFWSTVAHEMHHAANAIIDYYGEPYDGESSAYLHGKLMEEAYNTLEHGC